ncbi:hypothetical protein [Marinobacterium arenosum]|uniref:hypothetical protein n=1 Tax=Marinobacterium arenosum TaxID=2862496 RepID=UPI001C983643|nr:hypothetical protein [Marinobacterium arenosum]MBY4678633.1 hypothetical protein [Marinobacterium arenosum]
MAEQYKPLFNRNYLKVVLVICVLAVIWLSSMNGGQEWSAGRLEHSPFYWLEHDAELRRLDILLPTGSAISDAEQDRQQWRRQILGKRLQPLLAPPLQYQLQSADDHLLLTLAWPAAAEAPDLPGLLDALRQPVDPLLWQAELARVQAKRYLNQQQPDQQLLAEFRNRLGETGTLPLQWQQLFQSPKLIVSGPDAERQAGQLAATLQPQWKEWNEQFGSQSNRSLPSLSGQHRSSLNADRHLLLLAGPLPARHADDYLLQRLAAETARLALARQQPVTGSEYRLLWKSLTDGGYRALLIFSSAPIEAGDLQRVSGQIDGELVQQARQQLQARWQQALLDEQQQLNTLSLLALYNLPLDSLQQAPDRLTELDDRQVIDAARGLFALEPQFSLRINPVQTD